MQLIFMLLRLLSTLVASKIFNGEFDDMQVSHLSLRHILHSNSNTVKQLKFDHNNGVSINSIKNQKFSVKHLRRVSIKSDMRNNKLSEELNFQSNDFQSFMTLQRPKKGDSLLSRYPDETDKQTVLALAQMSSNGYYEPTKRDKWIDVVGNWSDNVNFGWERDGIRGYIYVDEDDKVMVITLKGTSPQWIDGLQDNKMFSCCCAYVDYSWKTVCNCASAKGMCDSQCLSTNTNFADSYYNLAQTIYVAIRSMYPHISIWLTGHSLGGSLASLVALTNNIPAFAYEAPGDLLFAERIGLLPDVPPNVDVKKKYYEEFLATLPIYHFGNDGDPIFLGICTGTSSVCYWGGYAMQSKCHVGKICTYTDEDDRDKFNSRINIKSKVDIRNHGIEKVLKMIETKFDVPRCVVQKNCEDCHDWEFN
ncbi:putative lipase atg15 [Clydaea vesicula]|uniref:triacylglycerol lipase n=1 Tax=Clydaea vesicula TaxID=447962 RepID=A0AAD5U6U2_9FUNG|nr:putative lipase atg15 [Clydaea vesicula]